MEPGVSGLSVAPSPEPIGLVHSDIQSSSRPSYGTAYFYLSWYDIPVDLPGSMSWDEYELASTYCIMKHIKGLCPAY